MLRLRERLLGLAPWDASRITDEWFRAHFHYAADVAHQWVGGALDVRTAHLMNFGCFVLLEYSNDKYQLLYSWHPVL